MVSPYNVLLEIIILMKSGPTSYFCQFIREWQLFILFKDMPLQTLHVSLLNADYESYVLYIKTIIFINFVNYRFMYWVFLGSFVYLFSL